jgi:hypothetical protein
MSTDANDTTRPPTSAAKTNANRENAKRSTGPRTEPGKARSRLNALQHGMTAGMILLPGEDSAELAMMSERLHDDLAPVGEFERELVERIISHLWRLRRVEQIEAELYAYRLLADCEDDGMAQTKPIPTAPLQRIDGIPYNSQEDRREGLLAAMLSREVIEDEQVSMGRAYLRDVINGKGLEHLGRYETTILRNLQRLWAELQARQATRST